MRVIVDIPDYDGNALDVIWDIDSEYTIGIQDNSVAISANKSGLISLAKQMLYLAYNDLPTGSHVHYDNFFTNISENEYELIIVKK